MSEAVAFQPEIREQEIRISDKAAEQLQAIMQSADDGIEGIRIFVTGGGCSGMTYGMTYAEYLEPRDKALDCNGFKVVVDAIALNYLKGCEIDFTEDGPSPSFVFNNVFQSVGGSGACGSCGSAQ